MKRGDKKKRRAKAANHLIENRDKYIRRYPEKDLARILKDSSYHSEEWEETDEDDSSEEKKSIIIVYER